MVAPPREADAGWIVQRHNQGAFVRDRDPRELADLFEARACLEGDVAVLAAHRRTAVHLDELDQILDRQAGTDDPGEQARINAEFHVCMAACSQNTVLTGYLRDLSKRVRFYFLPTAMLRRSSSLAEHQGIVDAVRRRDGDLARALVRAHVADTRAAAARTTADGAVSRPVPL